MAKDRSGGAAGQRAGQGIGLALALLALAALGWVRFEAAGARASAAPLSAERADAAARRGRAAYAAAERDLAAALRDELGVAAGPGADLVAFVRLGASECAGAVPVTGPYHCPDAGRAGLDLAALDGVAVRLRRDGERGAALVAARLAAARAAASLGWEGAEPGDCLVGVWAARGALPPGAPEPSVYGRALEALAASAEAAGRRAWRDPALFAPGAREGREAAYARGLAAGALAACAP